MSGIVEPVPRELQRRLRLSVASVRSSQRRLRFPPEVHVGDPAGPHDSLPADSAYDDCLRVDLLRALLHGTRSRTDHTVVWLTRPGALTWHALDAAWLGPALRAGAEADVPSTFVVMGKHGWYDPRSGVGRTWVRLRVR